MMRTVLLLLFVIWAIGGESPLKGADAMDEEESSQRRLSRFMGEAAVHRLNKAIHITNPSEDAAARAILNQAEETRLHGGGRWYFLWLDSKVTHGRSIAEDGFKQFPYSGYAGRLLHFMMDCRIEQKSAGNTLDDLQRLWLFVPDYPNIGAAMAAALDMAEKLQSFEKSIDLEADDPRDVVRLDGRTMVSELDALFRFLSRHGDRELVGPRASLALARMLLLSGDKDDSWKARRAYEDFLERFPDSPLVFDAVIEQALSHLKTYKGADYDVGSLFEAKDLVDIAELEVAADPVRAALVAAYRRRIMSWLQDRDLSVATWYTDRTRPSWLVWLKRPPQLLNPNASARIYARAVIARDRVSGQARTAEALLSELPTESVFIEERR